MKDAQVVKTDGRTKIAVKRSDLKSIIRDAHEIQMSTEDNDAVEIAKAMEVEARAMLAQLEASRQKKRRPKKSKRHGALKRSARVDIDAPLFVQIRDLDQ